MFVTRASTSAGKRSGGTRERAHTCGEGRKVNLAVLRRTTDGDDLARNHRAPAARVPQLGARALLGLRGAACGRGTWPVRGVERRPHDRRAVLSGQVVEPPDE